MACVDIMFSCVNFFPVNQGVTQRGSDLVQVRGGSDLQGGRLYPHTVAPPKIREAIDELRVGLVVTTGRCGR